MHTHPHTHTIYKHIFLKLFALAFLLHSFSSSSLSNFFNLFLCTQLQITVFFSFFYFSRSNSFCIKSDDDVSSMKHTQRRFTSSIVQFNLRWNFRAKNKFNSLSLIQLPAFLIQKKKLFSGCFWLLPKNFVNII